MKYMSEKKLFTVCGRPILHSKSPDIFRLLFAGKDYPGYYTRISSGNAKEILSIVKELNISGLNVTSPFKAEMFKLINQSDSVAEAVSAVNTILFKEGVSYGYNTDTIGVVETLKQNGIDLNNKSCLIVGYGSSAGAAVYGIKTEWQDADVIITGRNKEKMIKFSESLKCRFISTGENLKPYLIISTLPKNEYYDINNYLKYCNYFLDAAYPFSLLRNEARKYNCKIIQGEEWLVNQAIGSFNIFKGEDIPLSVQKDNIQWILNQVQNDIITRLKNIYLTGFSGSGKTSIGKLLAEKFGYLYFDTDKLIEERENLSINNIFQNKGEEYFRNVEGEVLEKISKIKNAVISCGGGTLLNENSIELAKKTGYIIWLHSPLEVCLDRIDKKEKPMLKSKSIQEIENLYNERKFLYCKSSDLLVANSGSTNKVVDDIIYEVNSINLINN